jgi:hypothetical protein
MSGEVLDKAKSQIFLDRLCVFPSKIKSYETSCPFIRLRAVDHHHGLCSTPPTSPVYWVVETNPKHTPYSIVRFYDASNTLVHEVTVDGVYINIKKAKYRKKLDLLLRQYNERGMSASKKNRSRRSI